MLHSASLPAAFAHKAEFNETLLHVGKWAIDLETQVDNLRVHSPRNWGAKTGYFGWFFSIRPNCPILQDVENRSGLQTAAKFGE